MLRLLSAFAYCVHRLIPVFVGAVYEFIDGFQFFNAQWTDQTEFLEIEQNLFRTAFSCKFWNLLFLITGLFLLRNIDHYLVLILGLV